MKRNESKLTNIFVIAWVHDHYVIVVLKYMCAFTETILLNKILKVIWDENSNLSFLNYWSYGHYDSVHLFLHDHKSKDYDCRGITILNSISISLQIEYVNTTVQRKGTIKTGSA